MKKIYAIGFYLFTFKHVMYLCYKPDMGAFLSPEISNAYHFMSKDSAINDAEKIKKYFFTCPIEYSIFEGTKKC